MLLIVSKRVRLVACVHTLKQLHYESKTKVKCCRESQAPAGLEKKQNTTAIGPGILRYFTKESDNYITFIKQLINTVIEISEGIIVS